MMAKVKAPFGSLGNFSGLKKHPSGIFFPLITHVRPTAFQYRLTAMLKLIH